MRVYYVIAQLAVVAAEPLKALLAQYAEAVELELLLPMLPPVRVAVKLHARSRLRQEEAEQGLPPVLGLGRQEDEAQ